MIGVLVRNRALGAILTGAMSRTPARFTEADIRRVIRAVSKEAAPMAVEIARDGVIRIVPYSAPPTPANEAPAEPSPKRQFDLL